MRDSRDAFHVAVPTHDLDAAVEYYVFGLGARLARRYDDRVTFDFFGDQLVCHLDPSEVPSSPVAYPRHFGITFARAVDFDRLLRLIEHRKLPILSGPARRFEGTAEEHRTIFLVDPSHNVLEFKQYEDPCLQF